MQEKILALARTVAGTEDSELLAMLCQAAEAMWTGRLRDGLSPEDCAAAFPCAAAFTAAADLAVSRGGTVSDFTAGSVSVRCRDGGETAESLRQAAERLMAPYTDAADLSLRGVRG